MDIKLIDRMIEIASKSFLAHGALDKEDLLSKDILVEKMKKILDSGEIADIEFVTDYSDYLLDKATDFYNSEDFDLSIVFYATFFEHSLNKIIDYQLREKQISKKAKNELIRSVNISGKCGWLLEVLNLPFFNSNHSKNIIELAERRNAFIHYKWNPKVKNESDSQKELIEKGRNRMEQKQ